MKLTTAIQEAVLSLVCFGDKPTARHAAALVPVKAYDVYYRELGEAAYAYLARYKKPPGDHTIDLFADLKAKRPDLEDIWTRLYDSIRDTATNVNSEYVLLKASAFVRAQQMKKAMLSAAELLEQDNDEAVFEAENILAKALKSNIEKLDVGLTLNNPAEVKAALDVATDDTYLTGIEVLDQSYGGPSRKTLMVFVAPPSRGKSWFLIHVGKAGLYLSHKRVLHVTVEMSAKKIARRYVQALYGLTSRKLPDNETVFSRLKLDGEGFATDWKSITRKVSSIEDSRKRIGIRLENLKYKPRLIIKEFPSGELTTDGLERYLDILESAEGFIPDMVIVDYADEMTVPPNVEHRHGLNQIYRGLRALAMRRNVAVVTASQTNRMADGVKLVTRKHIGEDWRKICVADTIITFSQTVAEERHGFARLFADKTRDEFTGRRLSLITQSYKTGQFCISSAPINASEWLRLMDQEAEAMGEGEAKGYD